MIAAINSPSDHAQNTGSSLRQITALLQMGEESLFNQRREGTVIVGSGFLGRFLHFGRKSYTDMGEFEVFLMRVIT